MEGRLKRRATRCEIAEACFVRSVDPDEVVDAWVEEATGAIELVLRGFVNKCTVNVKIQESA